jgi:tetratricopeptide (TPR) repeat protein
MHRIGTMEMEHLSRNIGKEKVDLFKEYITRKKNEEGAFIIPVCPLYDKSAGGCGVYPFRPLSCRIFGHFFLEGTVLPEDCVYREKGKWINASRYFEEIPFTKEFRALIREFLSKRPYTTQSMKEEIRFAEGFGLESIVEDIDFVDVIDRALHLELKGEYQKAYELFRAHEEENSDSPYYYFYFGNLCDEMEKYAEAIACFRKAISLKNDDSLFHFRLALDLVVSGVHQEAYDEFRKVIELNPENAMAMGYLGYLLLIARKPHEACGYLEKAVAIDPHQQFFTFRLGLAYLGMGKGDEAEALFLKVKDFPPVAQDVSRLLEDIARVKAERAGKRG